MRHHAGLILLAVLLTACGERPAAADSGIDGVTVVDGGCPLAKDAEPCPDEPLPARIRVTATGTDTTTAETTSDDTGHFHIPLPPGRYTLHPTNLTGHLLPTAQPQDVEVIAGRYTTV
ncbi:MAG: hypothetical protein HOY78_18120, partial [Saccharothrix sp.]|nr:hypothetical protein [Saccharothrix sp.]